MGLLLRDLGQGTLLPGASLLQVDKTISEVTEDPFHAPALKGAISPPGDLLLHRLLPEAPGGLRGWGCCTCHLS